MTPLHRRPGDASPPPANDTTTPLPVDLVLRGHRGIDTSIGGPGDDQLFGGPGNDILQ